MENHIIVVGGADCGTSPIMPYIGERLDGKTLTRLAKYRLEAALLRCGFDVLDIPHAVGDVQEMIIPANRYTADAIVLASFGAFGSRKSFNDVKSCVAHYSGGRFGQRSRILCEDICAKTSAYRACTTCGDGAFGAAGCPAATVDFGYLTCFDDAKLACDPDHITEIAEHVAMGVCESFGMPYVAHDDILSYPMLCSAATGKRGKKIKMLQTLLSANGYELTIDGIYGKSTDYCVKTFCLNNDLPEQGGVTAAVWRDLLLLNPYELRFGSKHNGVLYIQRKLQSKLYKTDMNGTFDEKTLLAVNEYLIDSDCNLLASKDDGVCSAAIKQISKLGGGRPRLF